MRLQGHEKKATTRDQRRRRVVRRRLSLQAEEIADFTSYEASDTERGTKIEPHEVVAWLAGWAPRPRIKLVAYIHRLWPQKAIYEQFYAASPFMTLLKGYP